MTSEGFIGLGSRLQQNGEKIYIIPGINVPIILRPSRGHYQLVGPCYIHGLMDGEAVVDEDLDAWLASLEEIGIH